jgi:hypothetical protein
MQTGYLSQLLGKRIAGIVLKESEGTPRGQLFLIFDDGTHFEFYCSFDKVVPTKRLWPHENGQTIEDVRAYMGDNMRIVEEAYLDETEGSSQGGRS